MLKLSTAPPELMKIAKDTRGLSWTLTVFQAATSACVKFTDRESGVREVYVCCETLHAGQINW